MGEGFGEVEGVHAYLPDVVPPADVKGGVVACHVAPVSTSVSSKEMSRMRALQSTMQSSQVPEVTALRYSLPTSEPPRARALLRRRCLACVLLHLRRLTSTQVRHLCLVHILISPSSAC